MKLNKWHYLIIIMIILFLSSCAKHNASPIYIPEPYGFFSGIWHGFILPIALLANLISWLMSLVDIYIFTNIQIIGYPNTGFFYYIGVFFGLSAWGSR